MTNPQVELEFKGDRSDLSRTVDGVQRDMRRMNDSATDTANRMARAAGTMAKIATVGTASVVAAGGVASLGQSVGGLIPLLVQAGGVAGLLPAALAAGAAVVGALKVGLIGVADGMKALGEDTETFNKAIENLHPNAQAFLQSLRDQKAAFDSMRLDVQGALFNNLASSVAPLAERYLPLLRDLFGGIAGEVNKGAQQVAAFMNRSSTVNQVTNLFGNLKQAIANLVPAIQPVIAAFLRIAEVGSSFLPSLTSGIEGAANKFNNFIQQAADSGEMQAFFQEALDAFVQIGQIFLQVWRIIQPILQAFSQLMKALKPIIDALIQTFARILERMQPFFEALAEAVREIMPKLEPVLDDIVESFGQLFEALIPLAPVFVELIAALLPILPPLIQMVADIMPSLIDLLEAMIPFIEMWVAGFSAVLPVITGIVTFLLGAFTDTLNFIMSLVRGVADGIGAAMDAVGAAISWVGDLISRVWGALSSAATSVGSAIKTAWNSVGDFFQSLYDRITRIFSNIGSAISGAFKGAVNGVIGFLNMAIGAINALIRGINNVSGLVGIPAIPQIPKIPKMHSGGIVPGAPGTEVLRVLQAGEEVIPASEAGRGGGDITLRVSGSGGLYELINEGIRRRLIVVER